MKALLRKIRQILKDRRTRKIFTRFISTVAAIVVFVTTYALVLPAITMESQAMCGIEAHQHSDSCYEKRLTCGLEESETHTHTDSCYEKVLVCGKENHTHSTACYHLETATAGAPIEIAGVASTESAALAATETASSDPAASAAAETTSFDPASSAETGSQDDSSLFGTDTSSHAGTTPANTTSADTIDPATNSALTDTTDTTFTENNADTESIADTEDTTNTEDKSSTGTPLDPEDNTAADPADTADTEASADFENQKDTSETSNADRSSADPASEDFSDASHTTTSDQPTTDTNDTTSQTTADTPADTPDGTDNAATTAPADPANGATNAEPVSAGYVPALEELNFNTILNKNTTVYYHRQTSEDKPAEETTADDTEEKPTADSSADDTEEKPAADSATDENENTTAADITDWKQTDKNTVLGENDLLRVYLAYTIPAGSLNETNPTARYRLPENIHLTDAQIDAINTNVNGITAQYINYETLEITDLDAYNKTLGIEAVDGDRTPADDLNEYLKNHNNEEFISATVRAENIYDNTELSDEMAEETPSANTFEDKTTADEENAFLGTDLVFTFSPYAIAKNQHEYDKDGKPTKAGEKIRGWLCLDLTMDQIDWIEAAEDSMENLKSAEIIFAAKDKELGIDEISTELKADYTATTAQGEETPGASAKTAEENAKTEKDSALNEKDKEESEEAKNESEDTENYPAISFDDRITVYAGTLSSDTEETDRPQEQTELTVHIEAEEGTFPVGTTMKLSTVEDMDSVAEAVGTAVEGQTKGFHAVDIAFYNTEGLEIEPLKPIKVSMTSEAIKQAVEDTSTVPVVVHVEDTAKKSEQETQDAEEDSVANNNKNDNAEASGSTELTGSIMQTEQVSQSETTDQNNDQASEDDTVVDTLTFEAGTFSVYAVVYTVDFHYEVNGKTYEFSIPGGGFVSFYNLIEMLGIEVNDPNTEENEIQELVDNVETIEFSNPALVNVSKVEENSTVGAIKERLTLECEYSAELTEEQITEINAQEVNAGDWALISLKPFDTEENLTVTMENGDQFSINVSDEQLSPNSFSSNVPYISYIYTKVGDKYYALKEDGKTVEIVGGLDAIEALGNEYKWIITLNFTEGRGFKFDANYRYYVIRPYNDDGKSLNLNNNNNNQLTVANGTYYNFIINHINEETGNVSGAYAIGGRFSNSDHWGANWPCDVRVKPDGTLYTIRVNDWDEAMNRYAPIWFYAPNKTAYEFNVLTNNYEMGYVEGWGKPAEENQSDAKYYSEASQFTTRTVYDNSVKKKNEFEIKAVPRGVSNPSNPKYVFDYWILDGQKLDKDRYGAIIAAHTLDITGDNINLVAHFSPNLNYQPTPEELLGRTPTTKEEFQTWINGIKNRQDPLVDSACNKTAEVYDYENRIYQVDLTAASDLSTFDGTVDMSYIIDVSASMKFPSKLMGAKDVYGTKANGDYYSANECSAKNLNNIETEWSYWGLKKKVNNKTKYYYVIADAGSTATVCMLWHDGSHWMMVDASKGISSTDKFRADGYHKTYWAEYEQRNVPILESTDNITGHESGTMAEVLAALRNKTNLGISLNTGDPIPRMAYLEASIRDSIKEMYKIKGDLSLASDSANDYWPKIAYNLFCGWMMNDKSSHNFVLAPSDGDLHIPYQYAGSTSTDLAILDAAGVTRSDMKGQEYNPDNTDKTQSPSTFGDWKREDSTTTGYTYNEHETERDNYGFQWDPDSTSRYALLITDGAPQRQGWNIGKHFITDAKEYFQKYSKDSEGNPATLVSVGLSLDNVTYGQGLLYNISDRDSLGVPYYYRAGSGDDLIRVIYETIQKTVANTIVTGKITDTISQSFYPVDKKTGNALKNGDWIKLNGEKITDTEKNEYRGKEYLYGVIKVVREVKNGRTENVYTVEWTNQNIKSQEEEGWHGTVYVKAKEDYLGGNFVNTNDGDAVIQAEGFRNRENGNIITLKSEYKERKTLSTPRVNVNELNITSNNTEWTVYLGEDVDPKNELEGLYDQVLINQVITDGKDTNNDKYHFLDHVNDNKMLYPLANSDSDKREEEITTQEPQKSFRLRDLIEELTGSRDLDWSKLISDSEKTGTEADPKDQQNIGMEIPYKVYGNNDGSVIRITLIKEVVDDEEDDLNKSPHATTVAGKAVEKYTLRVQFLPDLTVLPDGSAGHTIEDYHLGRFGSKKEGNATGNETRDNVHIINVYAKPLDVLKVDKDNKPITKTATFELFRAWDPETDSDTDDAENKVVFGTTAGYTGYKLNGSPLTGTYYRVDTQNTGGDGIAHFGAGTDSNKLFSASNDPYILIEKTAPAGYAKDVNAKTITIVNDGAGMNLYSDLSKVALPAATYPNTSYPYNWNQAAQFKVTQYDETAQKDQTSVIDYVNKTNGTSISLITPVGQTNKPWTIPNTGTKRNPVYVFSNIENTKEMVRDDVSGTGVFRISFLNKPGGVDITFKKAGGNDETGLAGAVFQLQVDKTGNGNYINVTSDDDFKGIGGVSESLEVTINRQKKVFASSFLTDGKVQTLTQLPEGTYKLIEKYIPDGYVNTLGDIIFKIEDGKMTMITEVNEEGKIKFVPAVDGAEPTAALLTVINESGVELPSTGGPGTTHLYILGLILTALAGAGMAMKHRNSRVA